MKLKILAVSCQFGCVSLKMWVCSKMPPKKKKYLAETKRSSDAVLRKSESPINHKKT